MAIGYCVGCAGIEPAYCPTSPALSCGLGCLVAPLPVQQGDALRYRADERAFNECPDFVAAHLVSFGCLCGYRYKLYDQGEAVKD